jgi:hypothetical protein
VSKQGLLIEQDKQDPAGVVMVAGIALSRADAQQFAEERAHWRSLSFAEQWAMAGQPRAKRSDALRAAEMALHEAEEAEFAEYVRSGQAAADERADREAQFDQRLKAAKGDRRPRRAGSRGAERPAGRRVTRRQSSSDDDGSDDPDGESPPGVGTPTAGRGVAR